MTGRPGATHHQGTYTVRARQLRTNANNNPDTRCNRCGQTQTEYANQHGTAAAKWIAGHTIDGDPNSPLAPEHKRCSDQSAAHRMNHRHTRTTHYDW